MYEVLQQWHLAIVPWAPENSLVYLHHVLRTQEPAKTPGSHFIFGQSTGLSLRSSPGLSGPWLRTTLHLFTRKAFQVTTRHRISTLLETFLASESELLVLLLAFVGALSIFSRGFGSLVLEGHIEEICFVGRLSICTLTFYQT